MPFPSQIHWHLLLHNIIPQTRPWSWYLTSIHSHHCFYTGNHLPVAICSTYQSWWERVDPILVLLLPANLAKLQYASYEFIWIPLLWHNQYTTGWLQKLVNLSTCYLLILGRMRETILECLQCWVWKVANSMAILWIEIEWRKFWKKGYQWSQWEINERG